ncbi:MAG TPA: hypothetical protein PK461_06475, partial [Alcaligenes faecalis]|nr:hypothetical protein [Alcaligenes faecalis]
LLIHNATRFPLVVPGLKKSDWAQLNDYFADALLNTLLKCGAHDKQMDIAQQYLRPLQANAPYDRSVLGTLNHAKADLEHLLWYDSVQIADLNGYRLGAWLADRPCSSKGHKVLWPQQAMLELLDSLP